MKQRNVMHRSIGLIALTCVLTGSAVAQQVISARSGLVHYSEGAVWIGDAPVQPKVGEYPEIKTGQHLRTEEGRAEVLLTPGVFLRVAENSEIKMVSNALTDTRIEILAGSVIVEAGEVQKDHGIELTVAGSVLEVKKRGIFRIDAGTPPRVRVYDGEVIAVEPGRPLTIKEGRQLLATSVPVVEKFAKEETDAFYRWAGRRSGYLAVANVSASRYMYENGVPWQMGGWYFNPLFGMFTYVPTRGRYTNAWNHSYRAPAPAYQPPPDMRNSMDGFSAAAGMAGRSMSHSSGGYSGNGGYQAPATSAAPSAPAAGPARGADAGSSRSSSGGGR